MSYDIHLLDEDGRSIAVENHEEGGTYVLGGTPTADLNVTYNYSRFYYEHLDSEKGIRWLYGKKASETVERLEKAVAVLGVQQHSDYWRKTSGNAGYALAILLRWARQHPTAVWAGD